ncbi:MAG: carbonic anhydrase family protein [Terracidiphilus sp.]|nr:carbonic anhydrase family protein [Terracidiphilus sp.]
MKLHVLAALLIASASLATAQSSAHWTYDGRTGPINWGKLDPSFQACGKGHEQSPIDIRGAHLNKALQPIEFHYLTGSVTLVNNGHTVQATVRPGSYIVAGGTRYDLVQFHFHHLSEEAVRGKYSDLDVHLVHKSADGKLAVVAIRFNQDLDLPNALLTTLWQHLPKAEGKSDAVTDPVNPGGFLPADRGYWAYTGSLTTPPCTEGVRWFVFEQEMTMSRVQIRAFSALFRVNSRPIQETHGRRIEASE